MTIGQTNQQWFEWRVDVKGALQSMHMGWTLSSEAATSVSDAISRINARRDLEIVFFSNENFPNREQLIRDAQTIAMTLDVHNCRPWVVLDFGLEYLQSLFEGFGITAKSCSMIGHVVHDRWVSQMESESA